MSEVLPRVCQYNGSSVSICRTILGAPVAQLPGLGRVGVHGDHRAADRGERAPAKVADLGVLHRQQRVLLLPHQLRAQSTPRLYSCVSSCRCDQLLACTRRCTNYMKS